MSLDWQLIVKIGAEGGSVALYGRETDDGWVFRRHVADQTPMFIDEESVEHDSETVDTWVKAVRLLERYPWANLFPTYVHPGFGNKVWLEVCKRALKRRPREGELDRWLDVCCPPEAAP